MAKTKSMEDPYRHIRRDIPPPEFPMGLGKAYNKIKEPKRKRKIIEKEIKNSLEEIKEALRGDY